MNELLNSLLLKNELNKLSIVQQTVQISSAFMIHLDVNNIYVNAVNHGLLMPADFFAQVNKSRVCYLHIAGHDQEAEDLLIDTHGAPVCGDVWDLLADTYAALPHIPPTLLERDFNFPSFEELTAEVGRIRDYQQNVQKAYLHVCNVRRISTPLCRRYSGGR